MEKTENQEMVDIEVRYRFESENDFSYYSTIPKSVLDKRGSYDVLTEIVGGKIAEARIRK